MTTPHKDLRAVIEQLVTALGKLLGPENYEPEDLVNAWTALTAGREALEQTQGEAVDGNTLLQAIARGWCSEKNSGKIMDPILALAIRDEVQKLYTHPQASEPAPSTAGEPRPVYGKPGTRDIDVAEAMKRWDAVHAQPAQGERVPNHTEQANAAHAAASNHTNEIVKLVNAARNGITGGRQ